VLGKGKIAKMQEGSFSGQVLRSNRGGDRYKTLWIQEEKKWQEPGFPGIRGTESRTLSKAET
jgi:hypothetical protein